MELEQVLQETISEMDKLKIKDIIVYNADDKSILADYFVISTADSTTQMDAARSKLSELMWGYKLALKNPVEDWHGGWCLLDFGNIIVHIFLEETRSFYDIESLFIASTFRQEVISLNKQAV